MRKERQKGKEYFLWFTFLSIGVFGFFISIDLFTLFMFSEVALIPMDLLIGVWAVSYTHLPGRLLAVCHLVPDVRSGNGISVPLGLALRHI